MICLREPSLGPCFGVKGGATGGGMAQVAPMAEINLHFTGDFHAITVRQQPAGRDVGQPYLLGQRTRHRPPQGHVAPRHRHERPGALRNIVPSLGNNGALREDHFDITVASEVMAVFCLAKDLADLQIRLGRIIVATTRDGKPVTARDLKADGAMAALLRDALMPNLVQSLEGTPALVHGGPFANIAHGCNSVMATKLALKLAPIVITEAGFGADLGGEKFLDIKCRSAGLSPSACVIVATIRALKMHGGVAKSDLGREDLDALHRGMANLARHVENMGRFGLPVVVALNRFTSDTDAEFAAVKAAMSALGVEAILCNHWAEGAAGAEDLAHAVMRRITEGSAKFAPIYPDAMPLADKLRTVAQSIYRARDIDLPGAVAKRLAAFEAAGYGHLPVCIAKTQYSFSADPTLMGAPENHTLPVREVRLSAGAGFIVAVCGDVMTMPGLPRRPSSEAVGLDANGRIMGLF